jgi:hypothetical protein
VFIVCEGGGLNFETLARSLKWLSPAMVISVCYVSEREFENV